VIPRRWRRRRAKVGPGQRSLFEPRWLGRGPCRAELVSRLLQGGRWVLAAIAAGEAQRPEANPSEAAPEQVTG
jgi:hypothetical protein